MAFTNLEKKKLAALPVEERERYRLEKQRVKKARMRAKKKSEERKKRLEVHLTETYDRLVQEWYRMYENI